MSPDRQNHKIALICRWVYHENRVSKHALKWESPNHTYFDSPPLYTKDLNLMHKAEEFLGDVDNWLKYEGFLDEGGTKFLFHATAAQRAEAFLRAFGLWEEDK
jgi:hypothetical protein